MYSTFLGGDTKAGEGVFHYTEGGFGIAVDSERMVYIAGVARSLNFPITAGSFNPNYPGASCYPGKIARCPSAFVAKLDPRASGTSSLIYSTFLGGSATTAGAAIDVDSSGNAYVTGVTGSWFTHEAPSVPFPTTPEAFQPSPGGSGDDAFVTKLNASGTELIYSTFLGGDGPFEEGNGITLDTADNAYVTGSTSSSTFPTTLDAFQLYPGGGANGRNGFLSKLNASGRELLYSTYLGGGTNDDRAFAVAIDSAGDAYVAGQTMSLDFPVVHPAFQSRLASHQWDAFLTKLAIGAPMGFSIHGVSPNVAGNSGWATIRVAGEGYRRGATVTLACAAQEFRAVTSLVDTDGRTISASFDLVGATPGLCDLIVNNPDGSKTSFSQGFTVEAGGSAQLTLHIVGPSSVRPGQPSPFAIVLSNEGSVDAPAVSVQAATTEALSLAHSPLAAALATPCGLAPTIVYVGAKQSLRWIVSCGAPLNICHRLGVSADRADSRGCSDEELARLQADRDAAQRRLDAANRRLVALEAELGKMTLRYGAECVPLTVGNILDCVQQSLEIATITGEIQIARASVRQAELDLYFAQAALDECLSRRRRANSVSRNVDDPGQARRSAAALDALVSASVQYCGVAPSDPNEKIGVGNGHQRFVKSGLPLVYTIHFENVATASAPASEVRISDPLDSSLDPATVLIHSLRFGDTEIDLPIGIPRVTTMVDLRRTRGVFVKVSAGVALGSLNATLTSIDPATGQPPTDGAIGFLPTNVVAPEGQGSITFSVIPKEGLETNTVITNQAQIIFDTNQPISTAPWVNTIDGSKPASAVKPIPPVTQGTSVPLDWAGTDTGSGLGRFTIYVSVDGGDFVPFLADTPFLSSTFTGQLGHSYAFYSIANDLVGNVEEPKLVGEATTTLIGGDTTPPQLIVPDDVVAEATGPDGTIVNYIVSAIDLVDGEVPVVCAPRASRFVLGVSTVKCSATDVAGNTATRSFTVTVRDTTAPMISAMLVSPQLLWPANHRMVPVKVNVNVSDLVDRAPICRIISVTSNEPVNGTADGDTGPDWNISGDLGLNLRAERAGNGAGRVYSIRIECLDKAGNRSEGTANASVPRNNGR
jgi:hypothetical protein